MYRKVLLVLTANFRVAGTLVTTLTCNRLTVPQPRRLGRVGGVVWTISMEWMPSCFKH